MYTKACSHNCMCIRTYVRMYVQMYVCMYVRIYVLYVCTNVCMHVCSSAHAGNTSRGGSGVWHSDVHWLCRFSCLPYSNGHILPPPRVSEVGVLDSLFPLQHVCTCIYVQALNLPWEKVSLNLCVLLFSWTLMWVGRSCTRKWSTLFTSISPLLSSVVWSSLLLEYKQLHGPRLAVMSYIHPYPFTGTLKLNWHFRGWTCFSLCSRLLAALLLPFSTTSSWLPSAGWCVRAFASISCWSRCLEPTRRNGC